MKYVITVKMARSVCRKDSIQEQCGVQDSAQVITGWRGDILMNGNRIYNSMTATDVEMRHSDDDYVA